MRRVDPLFTLRLRPVISPLAPWSEYDVAHDPGVVRDLIEDLRDFAEPTVLRVARRPDVEPPTRARGLLGDWLCDRVLGDAPRPVREAQWTFSENAAIWGKGRALLEAWEQCENGTWMVSLCARIDPSRVVLAACACVRDALGAEPSTERRARRAIEVAEARCRGEATEDEASFASAEAARAAEEWQSSTAAPVAARNAASLVASAASSACLAATPTADVVNAAEGALEDAATAVAWRSGSYEGRSRRAALRTFADLVRSHVPTLLVLRSYVSRPRRHP